MGDEGLSHRPDLSDPAQAAVHRAMEAVQRAFVAEYGLERQAPNVTIVVSVPPDGRVGVATTEPTPELALQALRMGWGATHHSYRLGGLRG